MGAPIFTDPRPDVPAREPSRRVQYRLGLFPKNSPKFRLSGLVRH